MSRLTLFRGDAEKIKEFDVGKTSRYCAVGQGVYLTNNLVVARSYMDKGSSDGRNGPDTLFDGEAKDRNDAYDKALLAYVRWRVRDEKLVTGCHPLYWKSEKELDVHAAKLLQKFMDKFRSEYREHIANGVIKAEYRNTYKGKFLCVTMESLDFKVGYLTEFSFIEKEFNPAMFKVEGPGHGFKDVGFWEIVWDEHGGCVGTPYSTRDDYLRGNVGKIPEACARATKGRWGGASGTRWDTLRKILEPYGYRGFEYTGGIRTGAAVKHRAFCVWQDEWLNEHKVRRFK